MIFECPAIDFASFTSVYFSYEVHFLDGKFSCKFVKPVMKFRIGILSGFKISSVFCLDVLNNFVTSF